MRMLVKYIYKEILGKIDLSKKELLKLRPKLNEENICCGPFVKSGKMCPTTTALSIKLDSKFRDNRIVSKKLKEIGVSRRTLMLFYLTFDLPAMVSNTFFMQRLKNLREVVDELIKGK